MKFLIWLVIGLAVVTWFSRFKSRLSGTDREVGAKNQDPTPEAMLQCKVCGLHVPASEAVFDAGGSAFCCEEHRQSR